ncbi:hypothetical protein CTRI78_v003044 [Colletotrichum trifolii]|uniref:Uncharacterized protein n=1 Tax=Colletotrichum trifolii TaxID=5466 RepID=A0A4R8RKB3_COLTR|nr:hypothetical protein CTRI78_v003044 [Colletotrichum trifolii]
MSVEDPETSAAPDRAVNTFNSLKMGDDDVDAGAGHSKGGNLVMQGRESWARPHLGRIVLPDLWERGLTLVLTNDRP